VQLLSNSHGDQLRKTYTFTNEEISRVRQFALEINSSNSQVRTSFASNERTEMESASDTFEGKLAEVAFVKFAQQFGAVVSVDYEIYPEKHQIDFGQDLDQLRQVGESVRLIPRIDIKSSRNYSAWLLIESYKFWSDAYIFVRVNIPQYLRDNIKEVNSDSLIEAEISGFAYHFDIMDPKTKSPWFQFKRGEKLFNPDPILFSVPKEYLESPENLREWLLQKKRNNLLKPMNVVLKCPVNYGFPHIWLRKSNKDWTFFFNWLKTSTISNNDILPSKQ